MVAHAHPALLAGSPPPGLRGVSLAGGRIEIAAPVILRSLRQDFIPHLLGELQSPEGRARLQESVAISPSAGAPMRLEQPVHRSFNLILLEASCRVPGLPRLDPARIAGAGLVVRRRLRGGPLEGWMKKDGKVVGWRVLPAEALDAEGAWDPDPARRRVRAGGANGRLVRRLPLPADPLEDMAEEVSGLFPVPPKLMQATGRTLLFGYLPVASSERCEEDGPPAPPFTRANVEARIPALFRQGRAADEIPPTATTVQRDEARPQSLVDPDAVEADSRARRLTFLVRALNYLAQEAGLFTGDEAVLPLRQLLAGKSVERQGAQVSYYEVLENAYAVLIERRDEAGTSVRMPDTWPLMTTSELSAMVDRVHAAMTARWSRLAPAEGRFDAAGATYEAHCFVRVTEPGCPSRPVWSPPTPPFTIKPWHESGDAPPVAIELPAPTPENLRNLKPNVAFKVPPELQELMDRMNLQNLIDGKAPRRLGIKFGMICGFNIPIITLCAFIVLQIFLVLLNIAFFWLAFIRICIPIPVPTEEEE